MINENILPSVYFYVYKSDQKYRLTWTAECPYLKAAVENSFLMEGFTRSEYSVDDVSGTTMPWRVMTWRPRRRGRKWRYTMCWYSPTRMRRLS